jgi:hypothetical protein
VYTADPPDAGARSPIDPEVEPKRLSPPLAEDSAPVTLSELASSAPLTVSEEIESPALFTGVKPRALCLLLNVVQSVLDKNPGLEPLACVSDRPLLVKESGPEIPMSE